MATTNWKAGSGAWTDASDWSNGIPGTLDTAIFDTGATAAYTVSGAGNADIMTVDDSVVLTGAVSDATGQVATVSNAGSVPTIGSVTVSGGGSWTNAQGLSLGPGLPSLPDVLAILGGGSVSVGGAGLSIGSGAALQIDPTGTLTGSISLAGTIQAVDPATPSGAAVTLSNAITLLGGPDFQTESTPRNLIDTYGDYVRSTASTALVLTGQISGSGVLTVGSNLPYGPVANGRVELDHANTYTGGTEIVGGTLELATAGAAGTGPITFAQGVDAALQIDAGATAPAITTANANVYGADLTPDGSGADTISVATASVEVFRGTGSLTFINGGGASTIIGGAGDLPATVFGGTGSLAVFAGAGGGFYYGGTAGNNVIIAGAAPTMIFGGGNGDYLYGGGASTVVASTGNETLSAAGSAGSNVFFGGSGADEIAAGNGNDTVIAGSGATTMFSGTAGNDAIFAGSGSDVIVGGGANVTVQAGTGNAAMFAGSGTDLFAFANGSAGGNDTITGFDTATDHLTLQGYGSDAVATALGSATVAGGSTTLLLSDNTHVTLTGVTDLTSSSFV